MPSTLLLDVLSGPAANAQRPMHSAWAIRATIHKRIKVPGIKIYGSNLLPYLYQRISATRHELPEGGDCNTAQKFSSDLSVTSSNNCSSVILARAMEMGSLWLLNSPPWKSSPRAQRAESNHAETSGLFATSSQICCLVFLLAPG